MDFHMHVYTYAQTHIHGHTDTHLHAHRECTQIIDMPTYIPHSKHEKNS